MVGTLIAPSVGVTVGENGYPGGAVSVGYIVGYSNGMPVGISVSSVGTSVDMSVPTTFFTLFFCTGRLGSPLRGLA